MGCLAEANKTVHLSAEAVAGDEEFWATIRGGYKLKPDYINLENGYYCFLLRKFWNITLTTFAR